ncbi:hypothetical protein ACWCQN_25105 [Streptomyces sp. NPDC001984]
MTVQRDEAWLRAAPLAEIRQAFSAGELASLFADDLTGQLTDDDLKGMSPEQIAAAHDEGKLNHLMGARVPVPAEGQLTEEDVKRMSPEEIVKAQDVGRLDTLLGRTGGS